MKKIWVICVLMGLLTGCATLSERQPVSWKDIKFPPLKKVEKPPFVKVQMENGMTLFLMEDHSLPLIGFKALIRTGSIYEPPEKIGLADITLETMRTGGAGEKTGDEIDNFLEGIGASISAGVGADVASLEGLCQKKNFISVFNIFRDLLTSPRFEEKKIQLAIIRKKSEIARRNDEISDIADREFRRLIYGYKNPYARIPEYETIENIKREDILRFYSQSVSPEDVILGIWGDFETEEMIEIVKKTFGKWKREEGQRLEKPVVEFVQQNGSFNLIEKKDATQSVVIMGTLGLKRDDPDYFAAVVLSRILGAGWNSRFSRILRGERAVAYEVWASFAGEFAYPGLFIAKAQTRADRTMETVKLMREEIERIKEGVGKEELAIAKEGIINNEVFWSDTKEEIIKRLITYQYYNYPADYPDKLIEGVKKVTEEDIKRVAERYLSPEKLTVLVVGNPEKFDDKVPPGTNIIKLNP